MDKDRPTQRSSAGNVAFGCLLLGHYEWAAEKYSIAAEQCKTTAIEDSVHYLTMAAIAYAQCGDRMKWRDALGRVPADYQDERHKFLHYTLERLERGNI